MSHLQLRRTASSMVAMWMAAVVGIIAVVAAVVLAGNVSLGSAVLAGDWVSSHEKLGRNRP